MGQPAITLGAGGSLVYIAATLDTDNKLHIGTNGQLVARLTPMAGDRALDTATGQLTANGFTWGGLPTAWGDWGLWAS